MILILTTSDTDILALSGAVSELPDGLKDTQALNPFTLIQDEDAFNSFLSDTLPNASLVLVRLLGGEKSMGESFGRLHQECWQRSIPLVACSGEPTRDIVFERRSTTAPVIAQTSFEYLNHGGVANLTNLLKFLSDEVLGTTYAYDPPQSLPQDGVYRPGSLDALSVHDYGSQYQDAGKPTVALLFYRAHWVSSNLEFVDAIIESVEQKGVNVLPVFCPSLREGNGSVFRKYLMDDQGKAIVDAVICTQSFSMSLQPGLQNNADADVSWDIKVLEQLDVPILQAIVSTESQASWLERSIGLVLHPELLHEPSARTAKQRRRRR